MEITMPASWLLTLISVVVAPQAAIWWRLGRLEGKVQQYHCPFGKCPLHEKAKDLAKDIM